MRHEAAIGKGPQQLIETLQFGGVIQPYEHALVIEEGLFGDAAGELQTGTRLAARQHVEVHLGRRGRRH
jgi:hypothetical protein